MSVAPSTVVKLLGVGMVIALASFPRTARASDAKYACISASTEGQTLRKEEKLIAARAQMVLCANAACPNIVRSYCVRWLEEIDAQIPSIVVRALDSAGSDLVDARATLTIDGEPAKLDGRPTTLDPGEHTVEIATNNARRTEKVILVAGDRSRLVLLKLPARSPGARDVGDSPSSAASGATHAIPTGAWILGGAGVAGLLGATYFGFAASHELTRLKASCAPSCTSDQTRTGRNHAIAFYGSLGVGLGALGGAVLWTIVADRADKGAATTARVEMTPLPGGAFARFTTAY